LSSFGAIYEVPVKGEYIVDTGHIVAFEKTLKFEITKPPGSSWLSAFLGGEGLVCRFKGNGRLFCQTHNAPSIRSSRRQSFTSEVAREEDEENGTKRRPIKFLLPILCLLSTLNSQPSTVNSQLSTINCQLPPINCQLICLAISHIQSSISIICPTKTQNSCQQNGVGRSFGMAAMDSHITLKSKVKGGLMKGLTRMLTGESLFISEFTAPERSGTLYISPGLPGDIQHYHLKGISLMLQSSAFVASSSTVDLDSKFQGLKGFFSGESLFFLKATGEGDIWFNSYGAILEIPVNGSYIVDTGYIVAFEDTLKYNVEAMGGLSWTNLRTGILGGEGLVCRFSGEGKLWIQSRNLFPLINFLNPFRPVKNN
jgi:uncharacterized protein (TIGR00266 family)